MKKKLAFWNPRNWAPWEQVVGAITVTLLVVGLSLGLKMLGALDSVDRWLLTPEGNAVSRAFAAVALALAIITSLIGAGYLWLLPFLEARREREQERIRQEVREALAPDWPRATRTKEQPK